jgi:hypothetical protein
MIARWACLLLVALPGVAWADPVSVAALLTSVAYTAGAIGTAAYLAATAAVIVVGSAQARRAQRRAEAASRAAFNASLQDRQVMIRSGIEARPVIYGRAMVSGPVVFAHSSGTRGEFLHLVVALAGHQCDAIETVYFNETALPAPDGDGFIQSGPFCKTTTHSAVFSGTGTSLAVGNTIAAVQLVTRTRGSGLDAVTTTLAAGSGYTFTGSTVSIVDGLNQSGDQYVVNYTWTQVQPRVRVRSFLGGPGQVASSELVSESGGRWTSAHVGTGICYLYVRLEYDQDIFGQIGVPNIKAVIRGKRVFDPRTSTTAWSRNVALCTRDYLLDTVHGLGAASGEVPDAEVIAAANICDEEVTLYSTGTIAVTNGSATVTGTGTVWLSRARPGMLIRRSGDSVSYTIASVASDTSLTLTTNYAGTTGSGLVYSLRQTRYTCDGVLSTGASARDNLAELVGAMAGSAVWVQGRWLVRAGAGRSPEFTMTEDFLAQGDIAIQARAPRSQLFNAVSGTFIDPANAYAQSAFPAVENGTYQTQDGGQRIVRDVSFALTNDATACQRLGKILLERARQALTIQVSTNLRAYDLVPSDWVALTLSRYGWTAKTFEVIHRSWAPGGAITYTLRETAAAVYDWALGEQTTVDLAPNTQLPSAFALPAILSGLTVTSGTSALTQPFVNRVQVTWTQSTDAFVVQGGRIEVEWKLDNATTYTAEPSVIGSGTSASFGPVDRRRVLVVRVRAVNSFDRAGPWAYATHVVSGSTVIGGGNVIWNAAMRKATFSSSLADHWDIHQYGSVGTVTWSRPTTGGPANGPYQRVQCTALGSNDSGYIGLYNQTNRAISLSDAGGPVTVSAYVRKSGSGNLIVEFSVEFKNAAGNIISVANPEFAGVGASWVRIVSTHNAPAGTTQIFFYVWIRDGNGSTAILDASNIQVEAGDVVTAFSPRPAEILAGDVNTTELAPQAATLVQSAVIDAEQTETFTFDGPHLNTVLLSTSWTNNTGESQSVQMEATGQIRTPGIAGTWGVLRVEAGISGNEDTIGYSMARGENDNGNYTTVVSAVRLITVSNGQTAVIRIERDAYTPTPGSRNIYYQALNLRITVIKR